MRPSASHVLAVALFALLAVMAVVGGRQMLDACGLNIPGVGPLTSACPVPPPPPPAPTPDPDLQRSADLQAELAQLQRRLAMAPNCPAPPPPPQPRAAAPPPPTPAPTPAPTKPEAQQPPKQEAKPKPSPENKPPERRQVCEVPHSDHVVLLLDASTSMDFSYNVDPALETRANELARQRGGGGNLLGALLGMALGGGELQQLVERMKETPGPSRISVAKRALSRLVDVADPGVTFEFVSFAQCGPPQREGAFGPSERPPLKSAIQGTRLRDSTALAAALAALPGIAPRSDKPVNVVLVSDGFDSCGGDPCAAARALERARPEINVNVVAVSRAIQGLKCVADATGGKFFEAGDVNQLARLLQTAAGQQAPGNCR